MVTPSLLFWYRRDLESMAIEQMMPPLFYIFSQNANQETVLFYRERELTTLLPRLGEFLKWLCPEKFEN